MNDQMREIGTRIKLLREAKGMSQEELARAVGYSAPSSRSTINKVELGKNDIVQSKLSKYAQALDTTVEYLLGIEKTEQSIQDNHGVIGNVNGGKLTIKNNSANAFNSELTKQEQDLVRIFRNANGRQQMKIMQLAYSIEEKRDE